MSGKGGRSRQGLGRIGQPPPGESFGPTSVIEDWFEKKAYGRAPETLPAPTPQGDTSDIQLVRPAPYYPLGLLRPQEFLTVGKTFIAKYSASGGDLSKTIKTDAGIVTVITNHEFFALSGSIGGAAATGIQERLSDFALIPFVRFSIGFSGGSRESLFFTNMTGPVDEIETSLLNDFDAPVQLVLAPQTVLLTRYKVITSYTLSDASAITGPPIAPDYVGWRYFGYQVPSEHFDRFVSGVKR